eukprot:g6188.t1
MGDEGVSNRNSTSDVLLAAAKLIGKGCGAENKAFLLCKKGDRNPEACLEAGKAVTQCSFNLIKELDEKHNAAFLPHQACLSENDGDFRKCRETEEALNKSWAAR